MFYAHFVLSKKGPLARIWLAAHWDRKLTKAHVFETNIERSVEGILQPKVKMALRTSGHLLLGVVRIYSRKAKYLLADCNEAFIKIKMAFRPGVVDLPEENREAALNAITLPEVFHDFDTPFQEINTESENLSQFTQNQSRAEDITIREDYANIAFAANDDFGDMGFTEISETGRDFSAAGQLFADEEEDMDTDARCKKDDTSLKEMPNTSHTGGLDAPLQDDGFGGGIGEGLFSAERSGGLFEPGGLFDDFPQGDSLIGATRPASNDPARSTSTDPAAASGAKKGIADDSDDEDGYYDMGPASMGAPSSGRTTPATPAPAEAAAVAAAEEVDENGPLVEFEAIGPGATVPAGEQTTLIQNEDETFALAPLEATIIVQGGEKGKAKRKRKLIIDEVKNISGEEMKQQMTDLSDIVTGLDLAPPTKQLMHWKETGGVEKLFALSAKPRISKTLIKLYQRHLTTRATPNEDAGLCPADDRIDLEYENRPPPSPVVVVVVAEPEPQPGPSGIKRKLDVCDDDLPPAKIASLSEPEDHRQQLDLTHLMPEEPLPNLEDCSAHLPPTAGGGGTSLPQPTTDSFLSAVAQSPHPSFDDRLRGDQPGRASGELLRPNLGDADVVDEQDDMPPQLSIMEDDEGLISSADKSLLHLDEDGGQFDALNETEQFFGASNHQQQQPPPTPVVHGSSRSPLPGHDRSGPSTSAASTAAHLNRADGSPPHMQPPTPYIPDDCNDADGPYSVGPPDEQGEDETYEQFEERVLNKRAQQMLHVIQRHFAWQDTICFSDLARNLTRKMVAQKFYTFLVLKKQQAVELHQDKAFSELYITKGPKLDALS